MNLPERAALLSGDFREGESMAAQKLNGFGGERIETGKASESLTNGECREIQMRGNERK